MKKMFTTMIAMLAVVGMAIAQDIYSVGTFTNSSGFQCAAVYLNGEKLFEKVPPLGDYDFSSPSVVVVDGDVYWALNSNYSASGQANYGDIYKNGAVYMNSPGGQYIHINDMVYGDGHLYSGGSKLVGSVSRAVIWKDNDTNPWKTLGTDGHSSTVLAMAFYNGNVYSVGDESNGTGSTDGKVWKNGEQLYNLGTWVDPIDVAYYDGDVYVLAHAYQSGYNAGWQYRVYKNNQVLYTILNVNDNGEANSLCIDAGDVFVTGLLDGTATVWKNGEDHCYIAYTGECNSLTSTANHKGVYHAGFGNGSAKIWLNNVVLPSAPANCDRINDLYVEDPCEDADIRTLPFYEDFETGDQTQWACWITTDADHSNGENLSYWHRCGTRGSAAASGDYYVSHGGNASVNQTGWLVSPRLFLQPNRDSSTLSFKATAGGTGFAATLSVRVSTSSDPNNADAYTEVWSSNSNSATWQTINVDLSAYQGQAIYIAFKYTGLNGWDWLIDDIQVTEDWSSCLPTATIPYIEHFDSQSFMTCYYVLDVDHSGDNKHWKYDNNNHYLVHPFGPAGTMQEGWIVNNGVTLPSDKDVVLTFNSKSSQPNQGAGRKNSVWIAIDETGVPDPIHYVKVWEQTNMSAEWTEVNIPLSEYAGHTVRVAFKYEGNHGHNWCVDDVVFHEVITEYTITANTNNNAWGNVTGGGTYNAGTTCTLTATPASGYQFQSWKKNGTVVSTNPTYTFTVTENATYTAYFGEIPINYYTITTAVNPEGTGSVTGGGLYQYGEMATLTATAASGYEFAGWSDAVTANPRIVTVTGDASYTAIFSEVGVIGVVEMNEPSLSVYPNPAKESIRIEGLEGEHEVRIYNSLGDLVKTVTINGEEEIGVQELASGVFVVRCGNRTMRFVKN